MRVETGRSPTGIAYFEHRCDGCGAALWGSNKDGVYLARDWVVLPTVFQTSGRLIIGGHVVELKNYALVCEGSPSCKVMLLASGWREEPVT